jgi:predicted ABC-type ATPase
MNQPSLFPIPSTPLEELRPPLLQFVTRTVGEALQTTSPVIVHLLGSPGAGKSTAAAYLSARDQVCRGTATVVAFDRVMESVPDYQDASDRDAAFHAWEAPARDAGYRLVRLLLEKSANIVFDHSGARPDHVDLLRYARERLGYQVAVLRLRTHPDVALARLEARFADGGRFVPANYVAERDAAICALSARYAATAHVYAEVPADQDGPAGLALLEKECANFGLRVRLSHRRNDTKQ